VLIFGVVCKQIASLSKKDEKWRVAQKVPPPLKGRKGKKKSQKEEKLLTFLTFLPFCTFKSPKSPKKVLCYFPDEVIYMHQPPGFPISDHPGKVLHLLQPLYGLKQSGRHWYEKLHELLKEAGF